MTTFLDLQALLTELEALTISGANAQAHALLLQRQSPQGPWFDPPRQPCIATLQEQGQALALQVLDTVMPQIVRGVSITSVFALQLQQDPAKLEPAISYEVRQARTERAQAGVRNAEHLAEQVGRLNAQARNVADGLAALLRQAEAQNRSSPAGNLLAEASEFEKVAQVAQAARLQALEIARPATGNFTVDQLRVPVDDSLGNTYEFLSPLLAAGQLTDDVRGGCKQLACLVLRIAQMDMASAALVVLHDHATRFAQAVERVHARAQRLLHRWQNALALAELALGNMPLGDVRARITGMRELLAGVSVVPVSLGEAWTFTQVQP